MTVTVPTACRACDHGVADPRPYPDPRCAQCGGTGIVRIPFKR